MIKLYTDLSVYKFKGLVHDSDSSDIYSSPIQKNVPRIPLDVRVYNACSQDTSVAL